MTLYFRKEENRGTNLNGFDQTVFSKMSSGDQISVISLGRKLFRLMSSFKFWTKLSGKTREVEFGTWNFRRDSNHFIVR